VAYIIYWPGRVDETIIDFLQQLHGRAEITVVSYEDEEITSDNIQGMADFLHLHLGPAEFVYIVSATHSAMAVSDRFVVGWIETDDDGHITSVWHNHPGRKGSDGRTFRKVWDFTIGSVEERDVGQHVM
jgi:hypothetical protein